VLLKMQNMERELCKAGEYLEALTTAYERLGNESMQLAQACGASVSEAAVMAWQHYLRMTEIRGTLDYVTKTRREITEKIETHKQGTLN
jgi:hypothetical protein